MPPALAKALIDTFSATLVRADGVSRALAACPGAPTPGSARGARRSGSPARQTAAPGLRTSQTSTTAATAASAIRAEALSAAAES
jgi:hypothetical protein